MTTDFDRLIPRAKQAGFIATATAAAITAQFGWHLGRGWLEQISLAILLALATAIVGYALVFAFAAYKRHLPWVGHAAVCLFGIGVTVEFLSHTGFTAANRDATTAQAKFQQTVSTHNLGDVDRAAKNVARLQDRLRMVPVRNADQAQAAIDNAMAHRFWTVTDGCKRTTGPQTRQFCSDYASAVADKAGAVEAQTTREELRQAEAELTKAREAVAKSSVVTSASASQGVVLASLMTASETPNPSAVFWAGIGISSILALFAISAGGLLNFVAFAFDSVSPGASALKLPDLPSLMANTIPGTDPDLQRAIFDRYWTECVRPMPGGKESMLGLYTAYRSYCARPSNRSEPLPFEDFKRLLPDSYRGGAVVAGVQWVLGLVLADPIEAAA